MGAGGSKETPLDALGGPDEVNMVEHASSDVQLAMRAKQEVNKADKYDEQSASKAQKIAAATEEEAAVEPAAEVSAQTPEDIASRAAPDEVMPARESTEEFEMVEEAKFAEQSASGVRIVAATPEEEAAVAQAAEGSAQEAQEDIASRAAPEHMENMSADKTATEEETVRRGSSAVSAGIMEAVANGAQSDLVEAAA